MLQVEAYATVLSRTHFNWNDTKLPTRIGLNVRSAKHFVEQMAPTLGDTFVPILTRDHINFNIVKHPFAMKQTWKNVLSYSMTLESSPVLSAFWSSSLNTDWALISKLAMERNHKKIFKCERCSFETSNRDTLKKHETTHSDLRPHKCHLCSLSFKRKAYLRNHLFTHKENRELRSVCDIFGHKAIRKEHLERIS